MSSDDKRPFGSSLLRLQNALSRESWVIMVAILIGLALMFFLSFFNRFAGLRSGDGEYGGGMALLSGLLPYRDYFTAGPPLNALKSALILKVFGQALIVSRIAGVLERLLIAVVLFRWLVQLFRPWHALAATFVTIVVSSGDLTDPIASYNHDAVLFAMLSGLTASLVLDGGAMRRIFWLSAVSGAFATLSLLSKQTVGLGAIACVALAVGILLAKMDGIRRAGLWCVGFAIGSVFPLVGLVLWLWRNHILRTFLRMLFVTGPAAKAGHSSEFLVRAAVVAVVYWKWLLLGGFGFMLSWRAIRRGLEAADSRVTTWRARVIWISAGVLVVGTAQLLAYTKLPVVHNVSKSSVYYVLLALTIWLGGQIGWLFRAGLSRRAAQAILFGALAWSISVMLSLSWPAFELMTLPGLAFLLAATLDGVRDRFRWAPMLLMAALVFFQVREKLDKPFGFGQQDEAAVRFANAVSTQPQLRGMRLPVPMVKFLDDTVSLVAAETKPKDTIFTYPEMGLLYTLTNRKPPTWAPSHNIDVINDAFAREEAKTLLRSRPAVIVYYRIPEESLRADEWLWRGGKPSGQRDLIAAVESLVSGYKLARTYVVAPGNFPIQVYVRK